MRFLIPFLMVLLLALPASSAPQVLGGPRVGGGYRWEVTTRANDTEDSRGLLVEGTCTVTHTGTDDVELYEVPRLGVPSTSGSVQTTFSSATDRGYVFVPGTSALMVKATGTPVGDGLTTISCSADGPGEADVFDQCRAGAKGGGWNPATERYAWTCGNYNWSAEHGGLDANDVLDWDTPTTVGGNSWWMNCTGDGVGSAGTSYEQGACLYAGERIKMYATADIVLALDGVEEGGTVYLPEGIYHEAYCGKDTDGNSNACPVTRDHPYVAQHKWTTYGRRQIVGEGDDRGGPIADGARTGTWLLSDHGSDFDNDGTFQDDYPPVSTNGWDAVNGGTGAIFDGDHWAWHAGPKSGSQICAWPASDTTGCVVGQGPYDDIGRAAFSPFGIGSSSILEDFEWTGNSGGPELCLLNDTSGSVGVCSGDTRVQCTDDTEVRSAWGTGGCPGDLGTCTGFADAIQLKIDQKEEMYAVVRYKPQNIYGENEGAAALGDDTTQSTILKFGNVTATSCGGGLGVIVELEEDASDVHDPFNLEFYDISEHGSSVYPVSWADYDNTGGGYSHLSVMPAQWYQRDSPNLDAECGNETATGLESDGSACDQLEMVNLASGYKTKIHHVTSWYGGGGHTSTTYAFSNVDGDPNCIACEMEDSLIAEGRGLMADASGWVFRRNDWVGNDTGSTALLKVGFGPNARLHEETFMFNVGDALLQWQNSTGFIIRDLTLIGNDSTVAMFRMDKVRRLLVDGVVGHGNSGIPFAVTSITAAGEQKSPWDIVVDNVMLTNQNHNSTTRPFGMIVRTDFNGNLPFSGEVEGTFVFRNHFYSTNHDQNVCAAFFEGQAGTDLATNTGLNRAVDDDRDHFVFENIAIEVFDGDVGGGAAFTGGSICFGDQGSGENDPVDAFVLGPAGAVKGPMPAWSNIQVNKVQYPDNPYGRSISAADAGDCGVDTMLGSLVMVHDLASTACAETANVLNSDSNDSTNARAVCKCTSSGTWAAF